MKIRFSILAVFVVIIALASTMPATCASIPPLREINYYPRNNAWLSFWENWAQTKVEMVADLDVVQDLGANTVRIFLHPDKFNYPNLPTTADLNKLEEALQIIDLHDLKAHLTLFDCWWSWHDVANSQAWLQAIVEPYQNDPRIALWELQNEVDLSQQVVRDWIQALFPLLDQWAGDTPCTVSVNDVEWLDDVKALTSPHTPDIYSLHWYPPSILSWTAAFPAAVDRARELLGSAELLIGEFGTNTCHLSEASQASLYRDLLYHADQKGILHLGAWTLYDFPASTKQCGPDPASDAERHFGLYRQDGLPKPAARVLRDAFHGDYPSAPSPSLVLNSSFEDVNLACGSVDNWRSWDVAWSGEERFVQDCTTAHSGDCSIRVQGVSTMTVGLYQVPGLPVESDRVYNLEGFAKTQNLDGWARLVLAWFDCEEQWLGLDTPSSLITDANAPQWTRLNIEGAALPIDACYYQVYAQVFSANADSYVWFDDITTLVYRVYLPSLLRD